jgi:hypothetical protein
LSVRLHLDRPGDLKPFGLQPARIRWTFAGKNGKERSLLVGNANSFDGGLYVMRRSGDEAELLMVDGQRAAPLLLTVDELRERNLLQFAPDSVSELRLDFPDRRVQIQREGERFSISHPYRDWADPPGVRKLLNILLAIRARRYLESPTHGERVLEVQVLHGEGQPLRLVFSRSAVGGLLARRTSPPGPSAEVDARWLEALQKAANGLRASRLLQFSPAEVDILKSFGEKSLIVAERNGPGWDLVAPRPLAADPAKIQSMLRALARLRVQDFVDSDNSANRKRFGLAPPRRTIELYGNKNNKLAAIRIGRASREGAYVLAGDRGWICRVDGQALAQLPEKESDFLP